MIPAPYLLYLGDSTDELAVKTSRGLAVWRPDDCVGEYRSEGGTLTLGLPQLNFAEAAARGARTLVVGVANAGGIMGQKAVRDVVAALAAGLNIASGLHDRLHGHPEIVEAAAEAGRQLFDVRDPPPNLRVGNGKPRAGRRLLTIGTDCSVGKMYTTLALERALRARGLKADFRATGQTGILIAQSGVPIDAVVADFISGAAEWISPAREDDGWDLIEGQGSLFHPSFAGVALGLLHGAQPRRARALPRAGPARTFAASPACRCPDLKLCLDRNLEACRLTSPDVIAVGVALNTSRMAPDEAERCAGRWKTCWDCPARTRLRWA